MRHARCLRSALVAALVGLAWTAYAQDPAPATAAAMDPTTGLLVGLLQGGGLPAVLAAVAWWARGAVASGIPVVVQLSDADRRLLEAVARREVTEPGVRP